MKKKPIVVLSIVMLAVIWWWVSEQSGGLSEEGVVDVWLTWGDDPAPVQALFSDYTAVSGERVRVRTGVSDAKVARAMNGSRSPDLVVLSTSDPVGVLHDQGVVEPLGDWIEAAGIDLDDIYPAPLAQCQSGDSVYVCLPWGADADALYWNKDLFGAAGLDPERPPQTMDELRAYAEALTQRDSAGDLQQVGFIPAYPRSHIDLYTEMYGGDRPGEGNGEPNLSARSLSDALRWEAAFYDLYTVDEIRSFGATFTPYLTSRHPVFAGRRLSCQQCHRAGPPRDDKLPDLGFYTGRIAMVVDGQWQLGDHGIGRFQPDLSYGVAPFPPSDDHSELRGSTVIQGPVALMPAAAADKAAAADLLTWMMRPETLLELESRFGLLPTDRRAAEDLSLRRNPELTVFLDLLASPNAGYLATSPVETARNATLDNIERGVFAGDDAVVLIEEAQTRLAAERRAAGQ